MQKMSDVFITRLDAQKVTELVASSIQTGSPVEILREDKEDPVAVVFLTEENDVAVGKTADGSIVAISLGTKEKRHTRKGTVAIVLP